MVEPAAPQAGKEYELRLGNSFLGKRPARDEFCTVRYSFKPESIARNRRGVFQMNKSAKKVVVELPHAQENQSAFYFEGAYEATKDDGKGEDCVAIFDPATGSFCLERLAGSTYLKWPPFPSLLPPGPGKHAITPCQGRR